MDMIRHEGIAIEVDAWPVELCLRQDSGTEFTDALLGSKDKLPPKGLGDDMVGDGRVNVAGVADLLAGRRFHLSTGAKCLPSR